MARAEEAAVVHDVWLGTRSTLERGVPQTALLTEDRLLPSGATISLWDIEGVLEPRARRWFPSAFVSAALQWEAQGWLLVSALLDSGDVRSGSAFEPALDDATLASEGLPLAEVLTTGTFVRELFAEAQLGAALVGLGRRRHQVGAGLVYDDFGTGLTLALDGERAFDRPLRADAALLAVGRTFAELETPNVLFSLGVEYLPSVFEWIGMFGAAFVDRSGALDDVFRSAAAESIIRAPALGPIAKQDLLTRTFERDMPSSGYTGYFGVDGRLLPAGGLSVRATALYAMGVVDVQVTPDRRVSLDLGGWAAQATVDYGVGERMGIGAFAFGLSGDEVPRFLEQERSEYAAFVGVAPYWTWTGLFFSGGVAQSFYAGRASGAGVNGHGVFGGGASWEWSNDWSLAQVKAAYLRAMAPSPPPPFGGGGSTYGTETDLRVELFIQEWMTLAGEVDVLLPGDFFPRGDVALRALMQLVVHHG